ncbi:MAG: SDR family NAD(P)-dependent oxidoreductase [Vicinamibacterales bacterium]
MKLDGQRRVLITGASRGIGRALAEALTKRRCTVGLVARNASDLDRLAAELQSAGGRAIPLPADVGDREQVERAVQRFTVEAGAIDVLIANAGVAWYGPFRNMPIEEAERMTRVNWLGTVYSVHAVLPGMLDRAEGHIAITSSAAGHRSFPWAAIYGATKFAQRGFLEALRHELSGTGVSVTGVYPGEVKTNLHDDDRANDRMPDWYRPHAAIPPESVADAIIEAIEQRKQAVFVPPLTRLLSIAHGISPKLANRMLRTIMSPSAAPWRG